MMSDKDTGKLYVQFLDQNNPKSKYYHYIRDFEAIQRNHSRVLSGVKTLCFACSFLNLTIHSFSFFKDFHNKPATSRAPSTQYLDQAIKYKKFPER